MNCLPRRLAIFVFSLVLVGSLPVLCFSATKSKTALVIGNSTYQSAPLRNPANDARDIANLLKRLGFQVTLKVNANRRSMHTAINAFGKELRNSSVGLFYYAGHGIQVQGQNFLIPVGAVLESESDVEFEAINAGRVLGKMQDADNNFNIIILDACRNNPFVRSFRSSASGLAKMDAPNGSILAYSTAPGAVAADGKGRNGLYTSKLLKHMSAPDMKIETMFKKVRIDVAKASGKKQTPWESSSLMGDFYFNLERKGKPTANRAIKVTKQRPKPIQDPRNFNAEEEAWKVIVNSQEIEDFELFLEAYPDSRFRAAARLKMQQLKRRQNAARMTTASIAPTVPPPAKKTTATFPVTAPRSGSRKTLAIIPWKPVSAYWNQTVVRAIEKRLQNTGLFDLAFSFYDVDREFEARRISEKDIIAAGVVNHTDEFWTRSGPWGKIKPRVGPIVEIGKYLKVNAVLICSVNIQAVDPPSGTVAMYLINIPDGKLYSVSGYQQEFDEKGNTFSARLSKELFDKISRNK